MHVHIVFTDHAHKYVSSSTKKVHFSSTRHAQNMYYHTSISTLIFKKWCPENFLSDHLHLPYGTNSCRVISTLSVSELAKAAVQMKCDGAFSQRNILCVACVMLPPSTCQREDRWPTGCCFASSSPHVPAVSQAGEKNWGEEARLPWIQRNGYILNIQ